MRPREMEAPPPTRERPAAVVMGLGPGGLGVVRSLSRAGVEVHGLYSGHGEVGRHSRLLQARWRLCPPMTEAQLLATLRAIRRRVSPDARMALFPSVDRHAIFVSEHRHELEEDFLLRVPPTGIEMAFLDKRATVRVCEEHGMPFPPSCVPDERDDVVRAAEHLRFPLIIKPALQEDPGFPGKNVLVADPAALLAFYDERPDLVRRSMFQELVPSGDGHIVGVNTYSGPDGRVRASISHRRLRQWLPDRGASCFAVSETLAALQTSTIRFLDGLGYVGFAGVEFAEDTVTNEYLFLELNARPVLPNQLFADAGVDLTAVGYAEMCGEPAPQGLVQRDGVHWMDLHRDLLSGFVSWRRGRLGLCDWATDVWRTSSRATYDRHDPKPFMATLILLAAAAAGRRSGRQGHSLRSPTDLLDSG